MKKVIKKNEEVIDKTEELKLNCFQALNYFKLIGRNRRITEKKYGGQEKTINEWESILKIDKLIN